MIAAKATGLHQQILETDVGLTHVHVQEPIRQSNAGVAVGSKGYCKDAALQQQDAQQCDIAASACAALVVPHAMPRPAVLSDVTEPSPLVSQLDSLMQVSAPMTLLCKDKSRVLSDVTDLAPWVSQLDSLMQVSAPMTLLDKDKDKSRGLQMCTRDSQAFPECRWGRRRSAPGSQASAQHDQIAQHTAYASAHQPQGSCNTNSDSVRQRHCIVDALVLTFLASSTGCSEPPCCRAPD